MRGRAVRKGPTRSNVGLDQENEEGDSTSANAQVIADLKEQVERAEQASHRKLISPIGCIFYKTM